MWTRRRKSKKQTSMEANPGVLESEEPCTKGLDNEEDKTERRCLANILCKN